MVIEVHLTRIKMPFQFITAIPLDVRKGSGCFVGIKTLATGIRALGGEVNFVTPEFHLPVYAAERMLFNHMLRYRKFSSHDTIVGFDADGYSIAGRRSALHVADIKGVMADVLPYEHGAARTSMAFQANLEKLHARRADLVVTPSRYCATRLDELYNVRDAVVIPELIDLDRWRDLLWRNPAPASPGNALPCYACADSIPESAFMSCYAPRLSSERESLSWRCGSSARDPRAPDYAVYGGNWAWKKTSGGSVTLPPRSWRRSTTGADVFCLPSVQEGFGIVFLEAMAAGKPIVAARASAVPEVVRHGLLVEPESADALADAIEKLYGDSQLRTLLAEHGRRDVEDFDMRLVARRFVETVSGGVREMEIAR